jgi:hypothetical protein
VTHIVVNILKELQYAYYLGIDDIDIDKDTLIDTGTNTDTDIDIA